MATSNQQTKINKIFGIGLNRTGSSSLTDALNILGYRAKHWNYTITIIEYVDGKLTVDYSKVDKFDAFTDTPIARIYKELDIRYPDSKFILTVRDINTWLYSCRRHFAPKKRKKRDDTTKYLIEDIYGRDTYQKKNHRKVYNDHVNDVLTYFKDRKDDLLVMDICGGDGWEKLCPFLGKPIPNKPFPLSNVARKSLISKIYYKIKGYSYRTKSAEKKAKRLA